MTLRLDAKPATVHWGYFDAGLVPVAEIDSGETVVVSTVSGGPETLPGPSHDVPQALLDIHRVTPQELPGHICTGPIAVRGAKPGDTLEVRIKDVQLHYDWGYTFIRPLLGALPDDFEEPYLMHTTLDAEGMIASLPWGRDLPLKPFFGVMGVAPPPKWGTVSTIQPRRNGGNLDNKELVAGTTLFLPVFVDDARFSVGDGHGAQGDGEVCVTAIETGLIGTFELHVRTDLPLVWPMAESPTHFMTMAFDPDLDNCVVIALREMLDLITRRTELTRHEAYALCSLAADVRITQVVNGNKGVHVMLEKTHLGLA
ncbi:MAG: acetamidase/formamidase family protein [Pseudomonadota bacterium]